MHQDFSGRSDMGQRTNDVLPAPQKILTAPSRTQPGRFGTTPSSGDPVSRFSALGNRNQQSNESNPMWNKEQNNQSNFNTNQQAFGRQQSGPSQRLDENKPPSMNTQNRFQSDQQASFAQKRPFGMKVKYLHRIKEQVFV